MESERLAARNEGGREMESERLAARNEGGRDGVRETGGTQ